MIFEDYNYIYIYLFYSTSLPRISHSAGSRYKCGVLHNIPYYTNNRFTAYFYEHIYTAIYIHGLSHDLVINR